MKENPIMPQPPLWSFVFAGVATGVCIESIELRIGTWVSTIAVSAMTQRKWRTKAALFVGVDFAVYLLSKKLSIGQGKSESTENGIAVIEPEPKKVLAILLSTLKNAYIREQKSLSDISQENFVFAFKLKSDAFDFKLEEEEIDRRIKKALDESKTIEIIVDETNATYDLLAYFEQKAKKFQEKNFSWQRI